MNTMNSKGKYSESSPGPFTRDRAELPGSATTKNRASSARLLPGGGALAAPVIEIIATGTELLTGEVVNSNAAWLAAQCHELGAINTRHVVVGDNKTDIGMACSEAADRADVVFVSGGLGPTSDDFTLAAAAAAFQRKLVLNQQVWEHIKQMYSSRGVACAPINRRMAELPEVSVTLPNLLGTAHGVRVELGGTVFFFLPGVPRELKSIFRESILPWLAERVGSGRTLVRYLRCFGLPESMIGERIERMNLEGITVGYRVRYPETMVKLIARGDDTEQVKRVLDNAEQRVVRELGEIVYSIKADHSLEEVVVEKLIANKSTLAVAESCTGGAIAARIVRVPGASQVLERGIVCYSNAAKQELLRIPEGLLLAEGAVSEPVARLMAEEVRRSAGTTWGLAVTGIAGPEGGTDEKPAGTVFMALAGASGTGIKQAFFPVDRNRFIDMVSSLGLDWIRRSQL